jgi:sugar lactone lactonase YvrE
LPPTINPEPASIVIGQTDFTSTNAAPGPAGLNAPEFLAFDHSGDLWVSDYKNSLVAEYAPPFKNGSSAVLEVGSPSFSTDGCSGSGASSVCSPNGIAFDPSGNLWVTDVQNDTVVEFTTPFTTGESVSTVIGGQSDGQVNASNLSEPYGIAFDSSGNLWVADASNNRVVEYKAPLTSGEAASLVIGQTSLTSTVDDQTRANMSSPQDVAFDKAGNLWVADTDDSRVMEFAGPFSNGEEAAQVIGQDNFTSYVQGDSQSIISLPEAIAFDHSNNLWVSDSGNSRVLEFAFPFSTGMNASRLIGQYSYFYGGPNATRTTLGYPEGLAFDASGNLWVADPGYARVLEYNDPLAYSASSTSSTVATTASTSNAATTSAVTTSTSSTGSGGGVPVFPYQFVIGAIFTALLVGSYLLIRRKVDGRAPFAHGFS